jgi:hypothetical protein
MKKAVILALTALVGFCAVQSLLALQAALKEKEEREKAAAEAAEQEDFVDE